MVDRKVVNTSSIGRYNETNEEVTHFKWSGISLVKELMRNVSTHFSGSERQTGQTWSHF